MTLIVVSKGLDTSCACRGMDWEFGGLQRRLLVSIYDWLSVSAPIWMASPPEAHSALLSRWSGTGVVIGRGRGMELVER